MSADQDAWENNRLLTSGAMFAGEVSLTFDDAEDQRVQLIVHSLKPPFLDGRVSFSMQQVSRTVLVYILNQWGRMGRTAHIDASFLRQTVKSLTWYWLF